MFFSRTAVHGIYAICYLSRQQAGDVIPSATVAAALGITQTHAAKVLKSLSMAGVVSSVRGRHGGYWLAKKMGEIRVVDVLDALNPLRDQNYLRAEICQGDKDRMCNAHCGLLRLEDRMRRALACETLEGLAGSVCTDEDALACVRSVCLSRDLRESVAVS